MCTLVISWNILPKKKKKRPRLTHVSSTCMYVSKLVYWNERKSPRSRNMKGWDLRMGLGDRGQGLTYISRGAGFDTTLVLSIEWKLINPLLFYLGFYHFPFLLPPSVCSFSVLFCRVELFQLSSLNFQGKIHPGGKLNESSHYTRNIRNSKLFILFVNDLWTPCALVSSKGS